MAGPLLPLTRSGSQLQVGGVKWVGSGLNCYWLGLNDNAGGVTFPPHSEITAAFDGMQAMGANFVRAHTIGISAGTSQSYLTGYTGTTPNYVEANLDSADWAVYQAGLHGIRLMAPLTDNWNYYHSGLWWFVHQAYLQNPSGITDVNGSVKDDQNNRQFFANTTPGLRIRALFKAYITKWLNHVNPYTGLAYRDDPTIAIVETGNEIYYAAQLGLNEWTQDIASHIKNAAPGKLVADGSAASGQAVSTMPGLTAGAVDIVGAHYYPQRASAGYTSQTFTSTDSSFPAGSARQQLAADITAATNANRAFIIGEFPWTRSDTAAFLADIEANNGIDGDMAWSFIGGTETHGGAFGGDDYPIHYPYAAGNEATYAPALSTHIKARATVTPSLMPVGDMVANGHVWRQIFAEDFLVDVPVGGFTPKVNSPGSGSLVTGAAAAPYGSKMTVYPSGFGASSNGKSRPEKVLSVFNSCLTYDFSVDATTGEAMAATVHYIIGGDTYGGGTVGYYLDPAVGARIEVSFKVVNGPGLLNWGAVTQLIANGTDWGLNHGELDALEGDLSKNMETNQHWYGSPNVFTRWGTQPWGNNVQHKCVIEWVPVGDPIEPAGRETVWIDDVKIGESLGDRIAQVHRGLFAFQTGVNAVPPPADGVTYAADGQVRGQLLVDYVVAYAPTSPTNTAIVSGGSLTVFNATTAIVQGASLSAVAVNTAIVQGALLSSAGSSNTARVSGAFLATGALEPYATINLPGDTVWTQTAGPATGTPKVLLPGKPFPGTTVTYTQSNGTTLSIKVLPHTLFRRDDSGVLQPVRQRPYLGVPFNPNPNPTPGGDGFGLAPFGTSPFGGTGSGQVPTSTGFGRNPFGTSRFGN